MTRNLLTLIFNFSLVLSASAQQRIWLDDLDLTYMSSGWKTARARKAIDSDSIRLNGKVYEHGVGTHASSLMEIDLHGTATRFHAIVGVDDHVAIPAKGHPHQGEVAFAIVADGKRAYYSDTLRVSKLAKEIELDLRGVKTLYLIVEQVGSSHHDHADWADAYFEYQGEAPMAARPIPEPEYILTPPIADQPQYNGASRYGVRPGSPVLIPLAFSGIKPITFMGALPKGLVLNNRTAALEGIAPLKGRYPLTITARNARGFATAKFLLIVGDTLALTPQMGWNSWNCWGMDVTTKSITDAARAMRSKGLADFGWSYINIDDGWQAERGADGKIKSNAKFADMKALADSVHGLGLKVGLYSSPGAQTCGGLMGSLGHEAQDAATYAAWGYDYLKYDWCSYSRVAGANPPHAEHVKPYALMGRLLREQKRDILFSLCQYGNDHVERWGPSIKGTSWRTTGDIIDTWSSLTSIIDLQLHTAAYAGPGRYNDPDMLVVGWLGWSSRLHKTNLTPSEQYYHITMWSLLAAPMLLGCDLTKLDAFTTNLLTNREVLAVHQDAACRQATRIYQEHKAYPWAQERAIEIWSKPLANGEVAIGIFNQGNIAARYTLDLQALGLKGTRVRDLWRQKDLTANQLSVLEVPRHGVVMLKVSSK